MKTHKSGYIVWLFGVSFWHRTKSCAVKRAKAALGWCNGEHNQIIKVATGEQVSW